MQSPPSKAQEGEKGLFPQLLHDLLEEVEKKDETGIVAWSPSGCCFKVYQKDEFMATILPRYFRQSHYKSFVRQLNIWGFSCISHGTDKGSYFNSQFVRGERELCKGMFRQILKGQKWKRANQRDRSGSASSTEEPLLSEHTGSWEEASVDLSFGLQQDGLQQDGLQQDGLQQAVPLGDHESGSIGHTGCGLDSLRQLPRRECTPLAYPEPKPETERRMRMLLSQPAIQSGTTMAITSAFRSSDDTHPGFRARQGEEEEGRRDTLDDVSWLSPLERSFVQSPELFEPRPLGGNARRRSGARNLLVAAPEEVCDDTSMIQEGRGV